MSKIINFDNARKIENCSNLCYVNSGIHLLYSLVEYREKVYNTDFIPDTAKNYKEQNELLYYLKYIFLLMNKDLTPNHNRYGMDETWLFCKRDRYKRTNNFFYNEIYYPFIKLIIENISKLDECSTNGALFINIVQKLSFISIGIFSFNTNVFYLVDIENTPQRLFNEYQQAHLITSDIQKYSIFQLNFNNMTELEMNNAIQKYKFTHNGNEYEYELIGCLVWGGYHYWTYIKDLENKYKKIDDIGIDLLPFTSIKERRQVFLLYKQSTATYIDQYPMKIQINNLVDISSKIKSENSCSTCTLSNLSTAKVCEACGVSLIPNVMSNLNYTIIKKLINYRFNTVVCSICQGINKLSDKQCKICTIEFSSWSPKPNL
jgi:hypothetical protein